MTKDAVFKIRWQAQYGDGSVTFRDSKGKTHFNYMFNILDENGESLSWYFYPVFKKIKQVYWDNTRGRLWLPKKSLYNVNKCKSLYVRKNCTGWRYIDDLAFFNIGYLEELIGKSPKNKAMSGLMKKGASLW